MLGACTLRSVIPASIAPALIAFVLMVVVVGACLPGLSSAQQPDEDGFSDLPNSGANPDGANPDGANPDGANPDGASPIGGLGPLLALENQLTRIIESADRSVVAIARVRRDPLRPVRRETNLFPNRRNQANQVDSLEFVPNEYGAGVVVDADGLILTTAHLLGDVEQNDYYVWLNNRFYPVQRDKIRTDPWWDLAVLPIQASGLTPIKMAGPERRLKRGQFVIALGNPHAIARDGNASASWGMVSNLRRRAPTLRNRDDLPQETLHESGTLVQTDARLEAGYSGGALLDLRGEMVGMTTAQAGRFGAAGQGGFAIPVDRFFLRAVDDLRNNRPRNHGYLGVTISDQRPSLGGVLIRDVDPNSSPFRGGLRSGHVVTHVDGDRVRDGRDLIGLISRQSAEDFVTLRIVPGGGPPTNLRVRLAKRPKADTQRETWGGERELWRGMKVEYLSAIRGQANFNRRARGRIGVLSVERDSPAWVGGIRRDLTIVAVDGGAVDNPADFYEAVRDATGVVTVTDGEGRDHLIPPAQ